MIYGGCEVITFLYEYEFCCVAFLNNLSLLIVLRGFLEFMNFLWVFRYPFANIGYSRYFRTRSHTYLIIDGFPIYLPIKIYVRSQLRWMNQGAHGRDGIGCCYCVMYYRA